MLAPSPAAHRGDRDEDDVAGSDGALFLSYTMGDAAVAERIARALKAAGIEVWIDRAELRGGDAWDQKIRRQIRECRLFMPLISIETERRPEGYFRLEWKLAVDRSHLIAAERAFLVPVVVDATPESLALVPDRFREVQWVRLPDGEVTPAFIDRIRALLADAPPAGAAPAAAKHPPSAPSPTRVHARRPWLMALLAIVALVALAGGAAYKWTRLFHHHELTDRSVAVLPFTDLSPAHDQQYFGDGMAEEILGVLANVPGVRVIGRGSSFQFRGTSTDSRAIGQALGAAFILEGTVRRAGDQVRITVELIDTDDGGREWSESYDRDLTDVLKVQGEIALHVARALAVSATTVAHLGERPSLRSKQAYEAYLRGRLAREQYTQSSLEQALADAEQALRVDPRFGPATELVASAWRNLASMGYVEPKVGWENARTAAQAALRLDPRLPYARAILADVRLEYDWDWAGAAEEIARARTVAPNDPDVLIYSMMVSEATGHLDEALRYANASVAADPLDPGNLFARGFSYQLSGRWQEAEIDMRRAMTLTPQGWFVHEQLAQTLLLDGQAAAAQRVAADEQNAPMRTVALAMAACSLHDPAAATLLKTLDSEFASQQPYAHAQAHAWCGQRQEALGWLDRAYEARDAALVNVKVDPLIASLRGEPRFSALLVRMHLAA